MLAALAAATARAARANAAAAAAPRAAFSVAAPRVTDHIVTLHLVLPNGTRTTLRGLIGTQLSSLLAERADDLAAAAPEGSHAPPPVALAPSGRGALDAVVTVPAEVAALCPAPTGDAARELEELAVTVQPNTRFASSVVLDAAFDGATLALAPVRPWATL